MSLQTFVHILPHCNILSNHIRLLSIKKISAFISFDYGLFNDPSEWTPKRVKQYKQRGFIAIYMPTPLYDKLAAMIPSIPGLTKHFKKKYKPENGYPATNIQNIYDQPLLRKIEDFQDDINKICTTTSWVIDLSDF